MIRQLSEMPSLVLRLIGDVETEVVEYKAAKQNYDFEDIGKYFSALSNEANLRGTECGWLLFGITNDREINGTAYRKEASMPSVGLRRLKREIAKFTNSKSTFSRGKIIFSILIFLIIGAAVMMDCIPSVVPFCIMANMVCPRMR